jgi:hypothetical protein
MIARRVRRAAEHEAHRFGLTVAFEAGGKHPMMVLNGAKRIAVASSPRTDVDNQADWVRQDVRRYARGIR